MKEVRSGWTDQTVVVIYLYCSKKEACETWRKLAVAPPIGWKGEGSFSPLFWGRLSPRLHGSSFQSAVLRSQSHHGMCTQRSWTHRFRTQRSRTQMFGKQRFSKQRSRTEVSDTQVLDIHVSDIQVSDTGVSETGLGHTGHRSRTRVYL